MSGSLVGDRLVVHSPVLAAAVATLARAMRGKLPVVLVGPSGVGKETLARAAHDAGPRGRGPYVAVSCGAIPDALVDSVLFGHVRGAFTGAVADATGQFAAAHGGTIFLDEIGALSMAHQPRLLRVLEDGTMTPVGGVPRVVDVKVVVASQQPLDTLVAQGRLREDLAFRLGALTVTIPPLRERPEDVAALLDAACARYALQLQPAARQALLTAPWKGNARELGHVMEALHLLCDPGVPVSPTDLPAHLLGAAAGPAAVPPPDAPETLESLDVRTHVTRLEKQLLAEALRRTGGNRSAASQLCGLSRRAFLYKVRAYGL